MLDPRCGRPLRAREGSRPGMHGLDSPRFPWRFDISLWYTDLTLQVGRAVEGVT